MFDLWYPKIRRHSTWYFPNTIREEGQVGILAETVTGGTPVATTNTWGETPVIDLGAGVTPTRYVPRFMRVEVEPSTWLHDVVGEYRDQSVSNVPAVDRQSLSTIAHAEGSLSGPFNTIMPMYFLGGIFGDQMSITTPTGTPGTKGWRVHEIEPSGRAIQSFSIAQGDAVVRTQIFHGMVPTSFELSSKTDEELKWTCEFMGKGSSFHDAPLAQDYSYQIPEKKLPAPPLLGTYLRVGPIFNSFQSRVLELDITFSREVELGWASGVKYARYANIIRAPSPTITFRAKLELQRVGDIENYAYGSTGTPPNSATGRWTLKDNLSEFFDLEGRQRPWHFRWATKRDIDIYSAPHPTMTGLNASNTPPAFAASTPYKSGTLVSVGSTNYYAEADFAGAANATTARR